MADLAVQFACVTRISTGESACGIIIIDQRAARPINESARFLGHCASPQDASFLGLVHVLQTVTPLAPHALDLRCSNEWLVRQITGASPIDKPEQQALHEQIVTQLLRFDS